jgi:hypothetical protein
MASIFDPHPVLPPSQAIATALKMQSAAAFRQLGGLLQEGYRNLWANQRATAEEIVAALGTDAADVFKAADGVKALLNAIRPGSVTAVAPRTFTVNVDGSITLAPAAPPA